MGRCPSLGQEGTYTPPSALLNPHLGSESKGSKEPRRTWVGEAQALPTLLFPMLGLGTLTSSASLVMGYFSRLEMTSSTATMFRI